MLDGPPGAAFVRWGGYAYSLSEREKDAMSPGQPRINEGGRLSVAGWSSSFADRPREAGQKQRRAALAVRYGGLARLHLEPLLYAHNQIPLGGWPGWSLKKAVSVCGRMSSRHK
jgi:hypothetical protein